MNNKAEKLTNRFKVIGTSEPSDTKHGIHLIDESGWAVWMNGFFSDVPKEVMASMKVDQKWEIDYITRPQKNDPSKFYYNIKKVNLLSDTETASEGAPKKDMVYTTKLRYKPNDTQQHIMKQNAADRATQAVLPVIEAFGRDGEGVPTDKVLRYMAGVAEFWMHWYNTSEFDFDLAGKYIDAQADENPADKDDNAEPMELF